MTRERLYHLRELIVRAAKSLTDSDAYYGQELYDWWNGEGYEYHAGDRVRFGENLYKCLQDHTSQESWKPDVSPSLWVRIDDPSQEWPEWVQPQGGTDAYPMGAKVSHGGKHWISDYDNNVWEPGVFGWHEVA